MWKLPNHLKKYIIDQDYAQYSSVDHAVWRFILRQLRRFLSVHAHEFYLEGLEKTGIETERIPQISEISAKLEKIGWRALPVSGFIPPTAFMELQALGILPIASDIRVISHLEYTPAPDIVHEAAGHAPMLAYPEYADYLKQYAVIARRAIITREDLAVYEAIRNLSDLKESPDASLEEIRIADETLNRLSKAVTHVSEAAQLTRLTWWTAEYGLIGKMENPKIYGAGLLSSIGEAKSCLHPRVRKIPLTVDCVNQSYNITEPQPQLFVTPSFDHLKSVLSELSKGMAFQSGGRESVQKAVRAEVVNTVVLNSGIQISGKFSRVLGEENEVCFVKTLGPTQLAFEEREISGQGPQHHKEGFSTPIGFWQSHPERCPSTLSDAELATAGLQKGRVCELRFTSGFCVKGEIVNWLRQAGRLILVTWKNCTVTRGDDRFFEPEWGLFDMAVGSKVISVYAGPADRDAFGEVDDFAATRVPRRKDSADEQIFQLHYRNLRELRTTGKKDVEGELRTLVQHHQQKFAKDWLFFVEALEIANWNRLQNFESELRTQLTGLAAALPKSKEYIDDGCSYAQVKQ